MKRTCDIVAMTCFPALAAAITLVEKLNLLECTLLFFAIPSIYIIARNPGIFVKSLVFALLFSMPLSLFVDTLAAVNNSWVVPNSIFPWRFFGVATVEVYIYGFLWVIFAVLFYEHFFDGGNSRDHFSHNIRYLEALFAVLMSSVLIPFCLSGALPKVRFFYSILGISLVIIPLVIFLFHYFKFLQRFIAIGIYFFLFLLLFELVALKADLWVFPGGDFIGFVDILGFRFPVEELVFWMCAATPSLLSYYEVFADDRALASK